MRLIASLLACLCFASTALADSIGVFTVTRGDVQLLRGENYLAASPGVELQGDDIIETGKAASAQVDMEDGSILKLGPDTRVALSDYKLDANKNVVSATLDILSGWLRFAVAKLKPHGKYSFNTPVLTVGVRGTEGIIEAGNEQGGLHLEEGAVDVIPLGPDIPTMQPLRVISGEFIQRQRGQPLAKLPTPPTNFQRRLPPVIQDKLAHRAQDLKERGVPPKFVRGVTRDDAKRMLERHPHMQEKLRERFTPLGSKGLPPSPIRGKEIAPDNIKDGTPTAGFGGQVLRDRQLKTGNPSDPKDVAEGLRKRFQQKQQDRLADPDATEKLPQRPVLLPRVRDLSAPQTVSPSLDRPIPRKPLIDQKIPIEKKSDDTPGSPTKTPASRDTDAFIQQPQRQLLSR